MPSFYSDKRMSADKSSCLEYDSTSKCKAKMKQWKRLVRTVNSGSTFILLEVTSKRILDEEIVDGNGLVSKRILEEGGVIDGNGFVKRVWLTSKDQHHGGIDGNMVICSNVSTQLLAGADIQPGRRNEYFMLECSRFGES